MAKLIRMPGVVADATSAILQTWSRTTGDPVKAGDCLAEVETDKAVVEISADEDGVMGPLLVKAGSEVDVGAPIAVLLAAGDSQSDVDKLLASTALPASPSTHGSAHLGAPTAAPVGPAASEAGQSLPLGRVLASPLARRIAAQKGVSLSGLKGSGPNGRIVKRDVEAAALVSPLPVATPTPAVTLGAGAAAAPWAASGFTEQPHSSMRKTIARRLTESKSTIPHFYLVADCRVDRLLQLRQEINAVSPAKVSVNDLVVRAVAVALRQVPQANVGWTDSALRQYTQADVAVAVSTPGGLITPVVRGAETKSLSALSTEIADLAARARAGQLKPEEYQGGSISVSNLGMHGVREFAAIINPPQAAILAVGAAQAQPVVADGTVQAAMVMRCTLSVDHRAIDGALAAQWLAAFQALLENPLAMLV